MYATSVAQRKG